jgi:hypothetical protein
MPTDVQNQPSIGWIRLTNKAISSQIARLSTLKLDDDLRVVILFSLLGLMISCALMWLSFPAD